MSEIQFISGLRVYKPSEGAPEWIVANGQIDRVDLMSWLGQQDGDKIRFDIKLSKKGTYYASVNNFKPTTEGLIDNKNIPF